MILLAATSLLSHQSERLDDPSVRIKFLAFHVIQHLASSRQHPLQVAFVVHVLLVFGHVRLHLLNARRQGNHCRIRRRKGEENPKQRTLVRAAVLGSQSHNEST